MDLRKLATIKNTVNIGQAIRSGGLTINYLSPNYRATKKPKKETPAKPWNTKGYNWGKGVGK